MRPGRRRTRAVATAAVIATLVGCHHTVTIDPIRVEPIHLTLDITVKVDRELERFFDFEDPGAPPRDTAPPADAGREGDPS